MKGAKDFLKENDIVPRISFNDTPTHTVKLLASKPDEIDDGKGSKVTGLKVLVEEDGEKRSFFTSSVMLITKLGELEEGAVVTISLKKRNNKSIFEITEEGMTPRSAKANKDSGNLPDEETSVQMDSSPKKKPVNSFKEEEDEIDPEDIPF